MYFRIILSCIFFSLISNYSYAIPRCEEFYNAIYNDTKNEDVNRYTYGDYLTIGFGLKSYYDEENDSWELEKTKDGYYKVGKITDPYLLDQINQGDIILSINEIDLRNKNSEEEIEILQENVSDLFQVDEPLKFHLLQDGKKITIENDDLGNKLVVYENTFGSPFIDFFIRSIEINEKDGIFEASIDTNYTQYLDNSYHLSKQAWKNIVYDRIYDEDNNLIQFWYEQCDFKDDKWHKLNTQDPAYGMKFKNLIKEDRQVRESSYNINVMWTDELINDDNYKFIEDGTSIDYNSSSMYTFKSNFNLRTFPFDKQRIKIHLVNNKHDYFDFRSKVSSDSMKEALLFKKKNPIEGWNITNVDLMYEHDYNNNVQQFYDGVSLIVDVERKHGYYIFKIILPILLILSVCWSAIWIDPKQIESRLTITIVCLLSLIAYNFVIDTELPKLEYLTIMDYIILVSYFYATIPNFITIIRYRLLNANKDHLMYQTFEKYFGLPSFIVIILLIILVNASNNAENSTRMLLGFLI